MPALFYDDSCNQLVECNHFEYLPQKQGHSPSLLRALLSTQVETSSNQVRELTIKESNQLRLAFKFDECFNNQVQRSHVPIRSFRTIGDWKWQIHETNEHHLIRSSDGKSLSLHPFCKSACFETFGCRGDRPLKRNALTYWEIKITSSSCAGTSLMIGIGRSEAKLTSIGYLNLIGSDLNSWGLSNSGYKWHNNQSEFCTDLPFSSSSSEVTIGCLFDGYSGRLAYFKNGQSLNIIIKTDKPENDLYPMVSSTSTNSQFKFEYVCESMPNLQELCRNQIRNIQLPDSIRSFLEKM